MNEPRTSRLLTGRLVVFLLATALTELGYTMTQVQIPVYLRTLGAGIPEVGLFFTLATIFPLLVRVPGGWLSDRIGRLPALVIAATAGVLGYIPYMFAPTWQLVLFGPALHAVTTGLRYASYRSYIAEHTDDGTRGRVFGMSQTIITAAWIVGAPIGGFLGQQFGYRWMFVAGAAAYGIPAVVFLVLAGVNRQEQKAEPERLSWTSLRVSVRNILALVTAGGLLSWLFVTEIVRMGTSQLSFDLMPVFLRDVGGLSIQNIGFLDGLSGVALVAASYPAGWLIDKTSERLGVVLSIVVLGLSRIIFGLGTGFWGFALSWMLWGAGVGLVDPAYGALIARGVPRRLQGLTYGTLATVVGVLTLPLPWLGSQVWEQYGARVPFLLTGGAMLVALLPALRLRPPTAPAKLRTEPLMTAASKPLGRSGATGVPGQTAPAGAAPIEHVATVLFLSLRRPAPSTSPPEHEDFAAAVREFWAWLSSLVARHQGTLQTDSAGTAVAWFGVPPQRLPAQVSSLLAMHTGAEVLEWSRLLNERRRGRGLTNLDIAIGVSTGRVRVEPQAVSTSAIGGAAAVASKHIQRLAMASGGTRMLISDSTYQSLAGAREQFEFGASGPAILPGAASATTLYAVQARRVPLASTGPSPSPAGHG
jgi:MFS family permease